MSLFTVGRVCMKIAGRDAGQKCVVISVQDAQYVTVDGATRRKKVNVKHLEPVAEMLEIKENASHEDVAKAFEKSGVVVKTSKPRKTAQRPKKQKKQKTKPAKATKKVAKEKTEAKVEKKESAPKTEKKAEPKAEVKATDAKTEKKE